MIPENNLLAVTQIVVLKQDKERKKQKNNQITKKAREPKEAIERPTTHAVYEAVHSRSVPGGGRPKS